jgi:hypothetical protein
MRSWEEAQAASLATAFGCTVSWNAHRWSASRLHGPEAGAKAEVVTALDPQLLRSRLQAILSAEIHPSPAGPPWPAADGSRYTKALPRSRQSS